MNQLPVPGAELIQSRERQRDAFWLPCRSRKIKGCDGENTDGIRWALNEIPAAWKNEKTGHIHFSLFTFHFHALQKEMATHSSILAWRIPGTEEPSGLLSMGSPGVRHDWSDLAAAAPVSQIHLMHNNSMHYCFQRWPPQFILFPFAIWMWISCHRVCAHSQSLSALWPHGL